jgi:hypothetical protein
MAPNPKTTLLTRPYSISNPPSRLRATDISYFNPECVDITEKTVIYTDVFVFTDILLHLAEAQYDDIRIAFPLCLYSTALF